MINFYKLENNTTKVKRYIEEDEKPPVSTKKPKTELLQPQAYKSQPVNNNYSSTNKTIANNNYTKNNVSNINNNNNSSSSVNNNNNISNNNPIKKELDTLNDSGGLQRPKKSYNPSATKRKAIMIDPFTKKPQ